jgi:alpha-glucosidase (family GH31 glycosyl hydrolase)
MGLSGCANMGCDIGGFAGGAPEGELLLRWIQSGVFQPRFTINSANSDNTVTQPWMYAENLPYVREAYALRYRMLPYLYSLMREANVDGLPVMRPLFLEFPDDPACYSDESLSFMYGPAVLVANVVEKGAFWATVDGEQIPRYLVRDVWEESEAGWYYELSDRSILVKTPKPKKDSFEIVISTEKFDLIGMADE